MRHVRRSEITQIRTRRDYCVYENHRAVWSTPYEFYRNNSQALRHVHTYKNNYIYLYVLYTTYIGFCKLGQRSRYTRSAVFARSMRAITKINFPSPPTSHRRVRMRTYVYMYIRYVSPPSPLRINSSGNRYASPTS